MSREKEICMYLRENHTGQDKAVFSRELEQRYSLNGRTIRRIISSLRKAGHPICSNCKGYYYARTQDEVNDTVCHLNELVTGVSNTRTGLLYARIPKGKSVVEIRISVGEEAL